MPEVNLESLVEYWLKVYDGSSLKKPSVKLKAKNGDKWI